ncbi:MAG: histidine kinase [Steroidobacteraceae bacterium]
MNTSRYRPELALLSGFWAYVTLSDVLYGASMQASLASAGVPHFFAPWSARLVQHVLLYPPLLLCMWLSRLIGWRPAWRSIPLQIVCGLAFASLASPAMDLGHWVVGRAGSFRMPQGFIWLASVTNFLFNYGFCLALLSGFDFYRRLRDSQLRSEALEHSLSAAQLSALRMQLSPHTLFNLLHTIRGNIIWDPAAAQSMIVQLGDLLRRLLRAGERDLARLSDEIDCARLYLQLQQRRFADRLTVEVPAREALPSVWVPSLLLQPLIENAVVHGLAHHEGAVVVHVGAQVQGDALQLRVVNTVAPQRPAIAAAQGGIGLRNLRQRLAIQFAGGASFSAATGPDQNWIAEIRMPLLFDGT